MTATRSAAVIDDTEKLTGCAIERAYVDKGYRGHDTANPHRVFISGQKRGVFGTIKRELRRRSAIEAVIGHMKNDGHLGRCYPQGPTTATPPTSSSLPSATTSASFSHGSEILLRLILPRHPAALQRTISRPNRFLTTD